MRRRAALAGILTAPLWPTSAALAQGAGRLPKIAILSPSTASYAEHPTEVINAVLARLAELGEVEGKTIEIEFRFADNAYERLPLLARELVATQPEALYTWTSSGARAAASATTTVPIVVGPIAEATLAALAGDFAHPTRNITGLTANSRSQFEKCLQLLKGVAPSVTRVGVLFNPLNPAWRDYPEVLEPAARSLGLELVRAEARGASEVDQAFAAMAAERVDGLLGLSDPTLIGDTTPPRILELITAARLPSISDEGDFAAQGGLLSLGADELAIGHGAADYIHRILHGSKPTELPVVGPRLVLSVSLKAAALLGVTIPPAILLRADEVIE
jgi:putative ABC transport system substrate-binding protein